MLLSSYNLEVKVYINNCLNSIIKKYGLEYKNNYQDDINNLILEIMYNKVPKDASIVIRGNSDKHAEHFISLFRQHFEIKCIIDDYSKETEILGIPIVSTKELNIYKNCYFLIGCRSKHFLIYKLLLDDNISEDKIIDIYKDIRMKYGINLQIPFYKYEQANAISYYHFIELCEKVDLNNISDVKEQKINKILSYLLYIRDFMLIDNILKQLSNKLFYFNLRKDILSLMTEVKVKLKQRKYNDIFIHWLDQVQYKQFSQMEYLNSLKDNALFFDNVYTATPYTRPTIYSMVYGKPEYFDKDNKIRKSELLEMLSYESYEIIYCGFKGFGELMNAKCIVWDQNAPMTLRYWETMNYCLDVNKPVFAIIQTLVETHDPYLCPFIKNINPSFLFYTDYDEKSLSDQIKISLRYVDDQMKFLNSFFESKVNIILSDHGKWENIKLTRYSEEAIQSWCMVTGINNIRFENRLFPYSKFYFLIRFILFNNSEDYENIFENQMILCDKAIFNEGFKLSLELNLLAIKECKKKITMGYVGIKKDSYKLIVFEDGSKEYIVGNEHEDIESSDDEKIVKELNDLLEKQLKVFEE